MANCSDDLPYAETYFDDASPVERGFIIACGSLVTHMVIAYACRVYYCIFKNKNKTHELSSDGKVEPAVTFKNSGPNEEPTKQVVGPGGQAVVTKGQNGIRLEIEETGGRRLEEKLKTRRNLLFYGLCPTVALAAFVSVCIPRTLYVSRLVIDSYMTYCMYDMVSLIIYHYADTAKLYSGTDKFSPTVGPLCCWMCFLPKVTINKTSIRYIKFLILQHAILYPLFSFIILVLWVDNHYDDNKFEADEPHVYLFTARLISLLVGLFGFNLTERIFCTQHINRDQKIRFYLLMATVSFYHLLRIIPGILNGTDAPGCTGRLSNLARVRVIHQMLVILEMFIIVIITSCLCWAKKKTNN